MYTLIAGDCSLVTKEFLDEAFPKEKVVLFGKLPLHALKSKGLVCYEDHGDSERMRELCTTYTFGKLLYISGRITGLKTRDEDLYRLNQLFMLLEQTAKTKILVLSQRVAPETEEDAGRYFVSSGLSRLCSWLSQRKQMDIKQLYLPHLYTLSGINPDIDELFDQCLKGETVALSWREGDPIDSVCLEDLASLIARIYEYWEPGYEVLGNADCMTFTGEALCEKIRQLCGHCSLQFLGDWPQSGEPGKKNAVSERYSWYAKGSLLEDLPTLWEAYSGRRERKQRRFGIGRENKVFRWIELFLLWGVFEFFSHITADIYQFSQLDLRMIYVVLMGCTYGLSFGVLAAVLCCLSLAARSILGGMYWLSLVYDPGSWLPFIAYLTMGAACGYLHMHSAERVREMSRDTEILQDKNRFLRQLYTAQTENKNMLKQQILGTRDSFGKLFELTQRLDNLEPQVVYENAIPVLEELMDNSSVSLYVISGQNSFARLTASSVSINAHLPRSLDLKKHPQIMEKIHRGEIWVNTSLTEGLPMYVAGIYRGSTPIMLVQIHHVDELQQGLYYLNLLKITCGLVQGSMLRAFAYSEATRSAQYYPDSVVLRPEWMKKRLESSRQMQQHGHASFSLLAVHTGQADPIAVGNGISSHLRQSDVLGMDEEGKLLLILPQTLPEHLPVVIERLRRAGYQIEPVPATEEAVL